MRYILAIVLVYCAWLTVSGCRQSGIFVSPDNNSRVMLQISLYNADMPITQSAEKATDITPNTTLPTR
jgi:hypothetical protein